MKKEYLIVVLTFVLVVIGNTNLFAHYPPSCNQTDCGLIVGSKFYSSYYTPGNPDGTPVSAGNGTWTRTSNSACGTYRYNRVNYTLYPHKFICSTALDTNLYYLIAGVGLVGYFAVRKKAHLFFPI
ncbi:hypothetical protein WG904_00200 [Pedobacter sp. Du54]|uniref:hypothetical protein n=1 Tax=Pedobacter anseongensis TaxID=3133439 RepID=UPI0030AF6F4B